MDIAAVAEVWKRVERELWVVTAAAGARRGGLVATFVSQAALTPELPRVLVGLAHQHFTRELIDQGAAFALHLFGEDQLEWVWRFGLETGRNTDKFAGLAVREGETGAPLLADAPAWLECRVEARWDIGGRVVYVGDIVGGGLRQARQFLTMSRMLELTPPDRLARLRELVRQDAALEEAAIRRWRAKSS